MRAVVSRGWVLISGAIAVNALPVRIGIDTGAGLARPVSQRQAVADGEGLSAQLWRDAHGDHVLEAALTYGEMDWSWIVRGWGVLLEVSFSDERDWLRFRATAAVRAALDSAPDPINGVFVYSGRGGSSAAPAAVRPRPRPVSGAAAIPIPAPDELGVALSHRPRRGRCQPPGEVGTPDQLVGG